MPRDRVRIGLIGCGNIAERRYLPGLATIADRAELTGVYDPDEPRMLHAVGQYGGRAYESLEALLADPAIEAVVDLAPPELHMPINLAALRAGKHLLTEKTLAGSLEDADTLIEEARARGLFFLSAPAIALSAQTVDLRRLIGSGMIGRVAYARAQLSTFGPAAWSEYTSDPTWFYQKGVGPLADLGIYMLHTLTELLGPVHRVAALTGISVPERTVLYGPATGKQITVTEDDNTQLLLDFGDATFAHLDSTFCAWSTPGPTLEIYGSEGVLALDSIYDPQGTLRLWRGGKDSPHMWETLPPLSASDAPTRGLHIFAGVTHLVDCLRTGRAPLLSAEHARHVLEIILTAPRASREGRTIELQTSFAYPKQWSAFEEDER